MCIRHTSKPSQLPAYSLQQIAGTRATERKWLDVGCSHIARAIDFESLMTEQRHSVHVADDSRPSSCIGRGGKPATSKCSWWRWTITRVRCPKLRCDRPTAGSPMLLYSTVWNKIAAVWNWHGTTRQTENRFGSDMPITLRSQTVMLGLGSRPGLVWDRILFRCQLPPSRQRLRN